MRSSIQGPLSQILNALKTNITSNIQAIKLNIFNKFVEKKNFEIFKQTKFEDE